MSEQRKIIALSLLLLVLASLVGPAWALAGDSCRAPIMPIEESACCLGEAEAAPSMPHSDCDLGCFIVCERPQGVDPGQSLAFHSFQTPLLVREFVISCSPVVRVVAPTVVRERDTLTPLELELPPEALPNPPPQLS